MTFCHYWDSCTDGKDCPRALTDEVKAKAEAWMKNAPICYYSEEPDCYAPVDCTCDAKPEHMGDGRYGKAHSQDCPRFDGDHLEICDAPE